MFLSKLRISKPGIINKNFIINNISLSFRAKQTEYESLFTIDEIENVDLSLGFKNKSRVFDRFPVYLHPAQLNYSLPSLGAPEVAFVGRSNVGKSSLIEALTGNRKLARISKEPGCTKSLNFFTFLKSSDAGVNVADQSQHILYLVDMPGYGFAKASRSAQSQWESVLNSYLKVRNQMTLRRVYLLVDSRHGMKTTDIDMAKTLNKSSTPYEIVLTKCDLVTHKQLAATIQNTFNTMYKIKNNTFNLMIHTVSSQTDFGMDILKTSIAQVLSFEWSTAAAPLDTMVGEKEI